MKHIKNKKLLLIMLIILSFCLMPVSAEAKVKLNKTKITLVKGKTYTLKVTGTKKKVKWSTNKKKVATVNSKGKVTAKGKGTATITAKIGNKKYKCKVTVKLPKVNKETEAVKKVESFSLNRSTLTIKEGESEKLSTSIYPSDAINTQVTWVSSNPSVAVVDETGNVTAISAGETAITAICGGFTEICSVKVNINFNEQIATQSIAYQTYTTEQGVIVVARNNYKYITDIEVDCLYYGIGGTLIGKRTERNYAFESGSECALKLGKPYNSNYNDLEYASYKVVIKASESTNKIENVKNISAIGSFGADNVMVTVKNNGKKINYTEIAIIFYRNGQVIGYGHKYADVDNPGSTDYLQFDYPYDSNFDKIVPDNFKIYVNNSYGYTWMN